jgi:DNA-binding NarL/FixJ family response regulator
MQEAFVVARAHAGFHAEELVISNYLQRLFLSLRGQIDALRYVQLEKDDTSRLTPREAAVLGLLARGLTAAAIGRQLGCSPRTVEKHVDHIYNKLRVRDRVSAVLRGIDAGLLSHQNAAL